MSRVAASRQIVTFRLGSDLFAADIFSVERVLRYTQPRAIPNVPTWIEGVVDFHSRVVPVIDLRKRFEIPDASITAATRLLVMNVEGDLIAATVDEVLDVMPIGADKLSPPPAIFRGLSAQFLQGMAHRGDQLVVVLDFARIFSTVERIVLERIRDAGTGE